MAPAETTQAAARRIASAGDLELAYPDNQKSLGSLILSPDSPQRIGQRHQPQAHQRQRSGSGPYRFRQPEGSSDHARRGKHGNAPDREGGAGDRKDDQEEIQQQVMLHHSPTVERSAKESESRSCCLEFLYRRGRDLGADENQLL